MDHVLLKDIILKNAHITFYYVLLFGIFTLCCEEYDVLLFDQLMHKLLFDKKMPSEHLKTYMCSLCSRAFKTSGGPSYHKKTHTGDKPYVCDICGKAFTQSGQRKVHIRTHAKKRKEDDDLLDDDVLENDTSDERERKRTYSELKESYPTEPVSTEPYTYKDPFLYIGTLDDDEDNLFNNHKKLRGEYEDVLL